MHNQSDQLNAMKHFRTRCNESLQRIGFALQDQAFDNVLNEDQRQQEAFRAACEYIARNPERKGLVAVDEFKKYRFSGCLVPGYPELRPFEPTFWDSFDKTISFLRENGLLRLS